MDPTLITPEWKRTLRELLASRREQMITRAADWVYSESVDLAGKRPRETTEALVRGCFDAYERLFMTGDQGPMHQFMALVTELRSGQHFHVSTLQRGFLSFARVLQLQMEDDDVPIVVREAIMRRVQAASQETMFEVSDRYQAAYTRELGEATRRAERARDAAEAAAASRSNFLAMMSHELRTPMNGVVGMSATLLEMPLGDRQRDTARVIYDSAVSLLGLLNDVLDGAKIEAGKMRVDPVRMDLWALLDEAFALLGPQADAKGLIRRLTRTPEVPRWYHADPARIRQIALNLLGNAIKFTDRGEVSMELSCDQLSPERARIRISVRDTGIGIPATRREHLFKYFEQADTSTTRLYGGTGLGLAISRSLAQLMGGTVDFSSVEGRGSLFWAVLELVRTDAPSDDLEEDTGDFDVPPLPARLLVVEDNTINQQVIAAVLRRFEHRYDIVPGGVDALHAWRRARDAVDPYALVLMDVHMPTMDGYETSRRIRAEERPGERVPIVALTAAAMTEERERCLAAGMDDHLPKPFHSDDLRRVFARWLPRVG